MVTPSQNQILLFGFTFCVSGSYTLCRVVADTIFLTRVGPQLLPLMLLVSAISTGVISFFWARRTHGVALRKLCIGTLLTGSASTVFLAYQLSLNPDSAAVPAWVYLLAELRGCFNTILIAVLLNACFDGVKSPGRFAFVNAASPLAGIVAGVFVSLESSEVSPEIVLLVSAGIDVIAMLLVYRPAGTSPSTLKAERFLQSEGESIVRAERLMTTQQPVRLRRFLSALSGITICMTVVLTLVSYEWRVVAERLFHRREDQLESYFGLFYAITDAVTLIMQLFVTHACLRKCRPSHVLFLLPGLLVCIGAMALLPAELTWLFVLMTVARGSVVLRRSLHDVALQVLYGLMSHKLIRPAVTRLVGIYKPTAEAVAAILAGVWSHFIPDEPMAWLWLPVAAVWIWSTLRLTKAVQSARAD